MARHIARHWAEIVGPRLAALSHAERLSGRGRDGVLHVAAVGAAAVLIEADSARVLERVNASCGRVVAGRVALRPLAATQTARAERAAAVVAPLRAVRKLERALEPVRDPELKSALRELGRASVAAEVARR